MTTYNWNNPAGGNWNTAADWTPSGGPPKAGDTAIISLAGTYIVSVTTADAAQNVTLDDANATLKDAGTLTIGAGGTLALLAGKFNLGSGGTLDGGVIKVNGSFVAAGGTLEAVTYDGTLDLSATNANLTVLGGISVSTGGGAGLIKDTGSNAQLFFDDTQTLDNATVDLGNSSVSSVLGFVSDAGTAQTWTLGRHASVVQTGKNAQIQFDGFPTGIGGTLLNQGTITAGLSAATLDIVDEAFGGAGTFTNQGSLIASNGGRLDLSGVTKLSNFSGGTLTAGHWEADAGSTLELNNNLAIATDNAGIVLSGAGSVIQSFDTSTSKQVTLDQTLTTIGATGGLDLLANRSFTNTLTFTVSGGLYLAGGTFTTSALTIAAGGVLAGFGTVNVLAANSRTVDAFGGKLILAGGYSGTGYFAAAPRATLDLTTGGALPGLTGGPGTLELSGATPYTISGQTVGTRNLAIDAGTTLSGAGRVNGAVANGGTVDASGGALILAGGASGAGTFEAASGVLDLSGGGALPGTIGGAGALELSGASPYTLAGQTIGTANVSIDSGTTLSGFGNVHGGLTTAGTVDAAGGTLAVAGALADTGALEAESGAVLALSDGGSIAGAIGGAGTMDLIGTQVVTLASGAVLGIGTVVQGGSVALGASVTLTNGAGHIWDMAGPKGVTERLSGGTGSKFTNDGTFEATGGGTAAVTTTFVNLADVQISAGRMAFVGGITNDATMTATGATLAISRNLGGTGTLDIGSKGIVSLSNGASSGTTVDFLTDNGILNLRNPIKFLGTIDGFTRIGSLTDKIDLVKTIATTDSYSNGVLTVSNGSTIVAELNFAPAGGYVTSSFSLSSDGHLGTFITHT